MSFVVAVSLPIWIAVEEIVHRLSKGEFAGEPVTVILDRRHGERRKSNEGPPGEERRRTERRHAEADEALRARGLLALRDTPSRPEETAPV